MRYPRLKARGIRCRAQDSSPGPNVFAPGFSLLVLGFFSFVVGAVLDDAGLERLLRARSAVCPRPLPDRTAPPRRFRPSCSFSGVGDSIVRDDFVCNDDTLGGTRQDGPALASDSAGNFVIAWFEFRDGDADVWFQRFDPAGNPLGRNQRMNTDASMGWQGSPAVSLAPDGRTLCTWEDRREIGNSDLFGQRFDASGNRLGDNFRVSDSGVRGDQSFSGCHLAPDGTAFVAWDDRRNGITGDIYAQLYASDGSRRGGNFLVNDDGIGVANQYEPRAGGDDSGRFVVAWMDGRGRNAYDWNVFCQRFDLSGNRLGANIQVTTDDSIQWAPALAVARAGHFAVCWEDRRRNQMDVYVQFYNSAGQPTGTNVRVNDDTGASEQCEAAAGVNRFGEFLVVWTDKRGGDADIYAQRFSASGSVVGANFPASDAGPGTDQTAAAVASAPDGGFWVVWADRRNGDADLYCRRFSRDGTPMAASFRVNDDSASSHQRVSSLAMDIEGNTLVAWEDERHSTTDIYSTVLDASGQQSRPNIRVNDDGPAGAPQYYAAAAGGKDRFLVTWTDGRAGYDIYGQFLDRDGLPLGSNFRVNSDTVNASQWYSYCAMDTSNRAVVVWMDTRAGDAYRIMCRRYDRDGNPVGPEFGVSDGTGSQYYASVAANPNGWFLVAWSDYRESDGDIYCQLFRPDGTRKGNNILVSIDTGVTYQGYPACALADDGRFAVAWEDWRNDLYDVYMQWFDSSLTRLGGNEKVNDNTNEADCYSPTCAFDPSGRLAIAFNDERDLPGAPHIWCQRFRPERSRISGNQLVNNPSLFPNNTHWTVGQSIAASSDRLVFAWTENRRHRGWDIFAKLTDWDLVSVQEPARRKPVSGIAIRPTVGTGIVSVRADHLSLPLQIAVYDGTGRLVLREEMQDRVRTLDLSWLGRGVYFCRLAGTVETARSKFVLR